jgi:hypothetical protein
MTFLRRHSLAFAYVLILTIAVLGFHNAADDRRALCRATERSWQQRHAMIEAQTAPRTVNQTIDTSSPEGRALVKQVADANAAHVTQRQKLEALDPRPAAC